MRTQPHAEWNQVKKPVLQTKPQCHEATPYMFTFLKNFSHEGLMEGIDTRIKGHTSTNKSLGKDFFVQLSAQSKDWKQQFLHLRHAVLSLAYTAEKSLNALDVKKLLGKELGQRSTKSSRLDGQVSSTARQGEAWRFQLSHSRFVSSVPRSLDSGMLGQDER